MTLTGEQMVRLRKHFPTLSPGRQAILAELIENEEGVSQAHLLCVAERFVRSRGKTSNLDVLKVQVAKVRSAVRDVADVVCVTPSGGPYKRGDWAPSRRHALDNKYRLNADGRFALLAIANTDERGMLAP